MYIPKTAVRKMLKDAGATRVSDEAISAFQMDISRLALEVAKTAVGFAKHAKRKTVDITDIKLAFNR